MDNILQNQAFNSIKTGNLIYDSLILIIVTKIIHYLTTNYYQFTNFWKFLSWKTQYTMTIDKNKLYVGYDSKINILFDAIIWYISREDLIDNFEGYAYTIKNSIDLSPSKNTTVMISFQGQNIKVQNICYENKETSLSRRNEDNKYYLMYYGSSNKFLTTFTNHVMSEYCDYRNKIEWKQKIHYYGEIGWIGYETSSLKTFDNLVMINKKREFILKDLDNFLKSFQEYKRKGVSWSRGYMLYGVPGCGKTSIISAISNKTCMDMYCIDLGSLSTDQELRACFRSIPKNSIVVFEDVDSFDIAKKRSIKDTVVDKDSKAGKVTLSSLLNELDGITNSHGRIVIMTTNCINNIDEALLRPGRIDVKMEFCKASLEEVQMCCKLYTGKVQELSSKIDGKYTIAEICNMINLGKEIC